MIFNDRVHAAELLARAASSYKGAKPLVLGIPRGGMVLAGMLARELEGEIDVVLVHKIGAPGQPEFAIGAVDESGEITVSDMVARWGISNSYIKGEAQQQLDIMRKRRALYTPDRLPINPEGRTVLLTDDGLATGATMSAALKYVRAKAPKLLVVAIPVASESALAQIKKMADDVICLEAPKHFEAVGQFYMDFAQVTDSEVVEILNER